MDRVISKALADCISQLERGAGVEQCLMAHPSHADELRPHLEAWQAMTAGALVHPSAAGFESGRRAMFRALETPPATFSPLAAARLAPAWATVAAAVAAFVVLMGGAAGASAALGGPDPAGDVLSVVGVRSNGPHGGIGDSSASDRGLECANPNAFEGSANSEDKAQNADDAHQKQSCSKGTGADPADPGDGNNGHGNDPGHDDPSNPGQGQGNHGTGSNAGGNGNPNGNPNGNANPNGNPNPGVPQGQGNGLNKH